MRVSPAVLLVLVAAPAAADPVRLRADALATSASPAGLLVLDADNQLREGLSAEAVVWVAGARTPGEDAGGDVLVIALKGQTRDGKIGGRLGRFVATLGAIQPVHIDGAAARVRLPARFDVEAVVGSPVPPTVANLSRSFDWMAGGRVARRLGDMGAVGLAYAQRRDNGQLAFEELAVDTGAGLGPKADVGARAAYDLANDGLAEVSASASYRLSKLRTEIYGRHRSASHLLPANSLFSVLGDVPSQRAGAVLTWKAAPRLDVIGDVAGRRIDDDYGEELRCQARLRLDARGKSMVSAELRRTGGGEFGWTGARAAGRIAVTKEVAVSSELELVIPDEDTGRGAVWPWGLVAASWERGAWQAAVAVEASSSADYRYRVDGLVQLARRWSVGK